MNESLNTAELAESFWERGYLVVEDMFAHDLMDQYQAMILEHFGESPAFFHNEEFLTKSATEVIPWFPQQEGFKEFDAVENDPRLQALTEAILGDGWYSLYCMTMFSRRGTKGQAWHQDCAPEDPAVFNMNRLIYTEDITPEIGGQTIVVPGSHRRGLLSIGPVDEDFADQVVLTPSKGTLVILHGHTWHRVRPVTGRYRVSTNYRCSPSGTPENITDICVYRNMRYRFETNEVVEERVAE
ncbi:MAG: phytanoyl-CoA dioxygenase family protein [Halieaceae bacterium]|nr:phytanoyl-CoA dioxygenase family protein [Halieaceae bacterium]